MAKCYRGVIAPERAVVSNIREKRRMISYFFMIQLKFQNSAGADNQIGVIGNPVVNQIVM